MSSAPWKNTIATDHTAGAPPSRGSTILVNIGWIENNSTAEPNSVAANSAGARRSPVQAGGNRERSGRERPGVAAAGSTGDMGDARKRANGASADPRGKPLIGSDPASHAEHREGEESHAGLIRPNTMSARRSNAAAKRRDA